MMHDTVKPYSLQSILEYYTKGTKENMTGAF